MAALTNNLSWSKSRAGTLGECPRQYYYSYYGSWGGWAAGADPRTREIYILKQLRNRPVWAGEVVHDTVQGVLEALRDKGEAPPLEDVLKAARERMRAAFKSSRDKRCRQEPKTPALYEHEYQVKLTDAEWKATAEHVDLCLRNFYQSEVFSAIRALDLAHWLELEELTGFDVDGVRVHVKLDFSHREDGGAVLMDWKTGKSSYQNHGLQFGCYSLYATRAWGLDPGQVRGLEVNLATGKLREHRFDKSALEAIEAEIRKSLEWMRDLLRDAKANLAFEEDFPKKEGPRTCGRCNFRKVCDTSYTA